jgi:late competence protein required for DNA uptake (superfamily II DNA/RNA helicase)
MEVRQMKNGIIERDVKNGAIEPKPARIRCRKCSEMSPEGEPIVVCACCWTPYCLRCVVAARLYRKEHKEKFEAVLPEGKAPCLEEVFATIDRILVEEHSQSSAVPPRGRGD